ARRHAADEQLFHAAANLFDLSPYAARGDNLDAIERLARRCGNRFQLPIAAEQIAKQMSNRRPRSILWEGARILWKGSPTPLHNLWEGSLTPIPRCATALGRQSAIGVGDPS